MQLNKRTSAALLAGIWLAVAAALPQAIAQQPAPAPAAGAVKEKMTLLDYYIVGGWCMHPILLLSIASVALVIRNYLVLREKLLIPPELEPQLLQQMANRDVAAARQVCETKRCLLTRIVAAGLERITGEEVDVDTMNVAMEEAGTEQTATFMTPIGYLSVIGTLAPMLGLLGTVSGMIGAFQTIASGGMGKPELLAGDIGEALITTYAGLTVAIPTMGFYFYFKNKFVKIMATAGRISGRLLEAFKTGKLPAVVAEAPVAAEPASAPEASATDA